MYIFNNRGYQPFISSQGYKLVRLSSDKNVKVIAWSVRNLYTSKIELQLKQ